MGKINVEKPKDRVEDNYLTPEIPGIKPELKENVEMRAVGMCKKDGLWHTFDVRFKGKTVLEVNYSEPDIRMIAQMNFKIKAQKHWDELMKEDDFGPIKV